MKWVIRGSGEEREVEVVRVAGGFEVTLNGDARRVEISRLNDREASLRYVDDNRSYYVVGNGSRDRHFQLSVLERDYCLEVLTPLEAQVGDVAAGGEGPSRLEAPIPGKVVAVKVSPGDKVEPGQALVVLEAMKMENELAAEQAGTVSAVHVQPGATVATGALLVELE